MQKKGFTLIELLVVISIIALLLSILMPSLSLAKELARSVVCSSNLRQLILANKNYSAESDGYYVGDYSRKEAQDMGIPHMPFWPSNKKFLTILGLKPDQIRDSLTPLGYRWPDDYICPSFPRTNNENYFGHKLSYGYNRDGYDWYNKVDPFAIKAEKIARPVSQKCMFVDSNGWWVKRGSADYTYHWDLTGAKLDDQGQTAVLYHHNRESANVGFFDGHVDKLTKQKLFVLPDNRTNRRPPRPGEFGIKRENDKIWKIK